LRILFATTRGAGHFNPLVPFIDAALRGGHDALVAGPGVLAETVERAGYSFWPVEAPPEHLLGPTWGRVQTAATPEEADAIVIREIFGRLNVQAALPRMRTACDEWRPDLILREPAEFASAIAAELAAIPHTRVGIGLASSDRQMMEIASPAVEERSPGVTEAILRSPYLTLWPASLEDPGHAGPVDTRRFHDPAADARPGPLGDWWPGDDRPLVYLSFGSVTGGLPVAPALYRAALEAAAQVPARVLVTVGSELNLEALGAPPPNVHLTRWVPQVDAFAAASLVVCHGGSGTTLGALAAGLPLVIVPLFADQPANARRVAEVGAGLLVEPLFEGPSKALPSSIDPGALREAILAGHRDDALARSAQAIAEEMRALPPVDDALRQGARR
jgi:UDP:flavonoid glycosyltransferase YjiC (YdhE family)